MPPTIAELYSSPDHYLHSFDGDAAVFVTMDQAAYRRSIFLDARIAPANPEPLRVPLDGLLAQVPPPRPLAWIFHVAHCGSTLLARALEALDGTRLVLREPLALRQVALEPDPVRLWLVRTMLAKRYPGAGATLVKANVPVNFILPELGAADQDARAIFLSLGLRDYCLAILRSEQHRAWLRHVTGLLGAWLDPFDPSSDGQAAAALWLAQISRFAAALEAMPNARSLDGERFLQSPVDSVARAAVALGMAADDAAVARLADSPLFTTYSKRPGLAFDNAARLARRRSDEAALEADIGAAEAWIARHPGAADAARATLESRAL
jgi:hypothetical protein